MKCVFCGSVFPVDTKVCFICDEYKGLEPIEPERKPVLLGSALNDVFAMIEEARKAHLELGGCDDPDCNCDDEVEGDN
jgi:hypothetical protein